MSCSIISRGRLVPKRLLLRSREYLSLINFRSWNRLYPVPVTTVGTHVLTLCQTTKLMIDPFGTSTYTHPPRSHTPLCLFYSSLSKSKHPVWSPFALIILRSRDLRTFPLLNILQKPRRLAALITQVFFQLKKPRPRREKQSFLLCLFVY